MEELVKYVKATIIKLIGFTCIVAAVLVAIGCQQYTIGWCVGSALNIIYFLMLSSRSARAIHLPPEQMATFIRGGAVFRLLMICLMCIIILQFPIIHFGAAVAGIFSYRIIIIADGIGKLIRDR